MGYVPPRRPPRLNLDRHGMPLDYASYMWLLYRKHVEDRSPARLAFLHGPDDGSLRDTARRIQDNIFDGDPGDFGTQVVWK